MNRFIPILFLFGLFHWGSVAAQYEENTVTMPEERNSIGFNLTPAAVVFMNGENVNSRFSLIYKRQTQISFRWRFTLNYEVLDRVNEDILDRRIVFFNDTLVTYRTDNRLHQAFDFRAGMEWFKPNRTFSMVYGFDLFAGLQYERDGIEESSWDRDSTFIYTPSVYVPAYQYEQEITFGYAGFDFSMGTQIQASENVFFVIRWTPQFAVLFPLSEFYSDLDRRDVPPSQSATFRLRGLEVYANIRF